MSRRTIYILAAIAVVFLAGAYILGTDQGRQSGEQAKTRLELVWPSLMELPETDRAVLAGFSMTCRIEQRPATAPEVIACLREAAANPDAIRPKDMGQAEAAARLETLIEQAQVK